MINNPSVRRALKAGIATAVMGAALVSTAGPSSAATETGWVGATPPTGGVVYLHSSTVTDTPGLAASTVVYSSFGQMVPEFRMGVQSRLFKSGVLCKITPWQYNPTSSSRLENATSGDCGSGSYNSHGFIQVSDGPNWTTHVTFPTNPIEYAAPSAPAARTSAPTPNDLAIQTNANGQTYGSAAEASSPDELPDLVASFGSEGQFGYVRAEDLRRIGAGDAELPLVDKDGRAIGSFQIR